MLKLVSLLAIAGLFACSPTHDEDLGKLPTSTLTASFDGADYATDVEKVAHGRRIADVLGCNSCHLEDYSGVNFGEFVPIVEGLWATNISLTLPEMTDDQIERLLREGVHPEREIYLMPSKQSQFLSERDMDALIAFLRTIEPTGGPSPPPPPGFEEAVTSRLPDDYWLQSEDGEPRSYHNAAEEAAYFAKHAAPDLGEYPQGRLIALSVCTSCHGASLDGVGEPAGDVQASLEYSQDEFVRLLREGLDRNGQPLGMNWGSEHAPPGLTNEEIEAVISYTKLLAKHYKGKPEPSSRPATHKAPGPDV